MSLTGLSLALSLGLISITLPTPGHHPTTGLANKMVVSLGRLCEAAGKQPTLGHLLSPQNSGVDTWWLKPFPHADHSLLAPLMWLHWSGLWWGGSTVWLDRGCRQGLDLWGLFPMSHRLWWWHGDGDPTQHPVFWGVLMG